MDKILHAGSRPHPPKRPAPFSPGFPAPFSRPNPETSLMDVDESLADPVDRTADAGASVPWNPESSAVSILAPTTDDPLDEPPSIDRASPSSPSGVGGSLSAPKKRPRTPQESQRGKSDERPEPQEPAPARVVPPYRAPVSPVNPVASEAAFPLAIGLSSSLEQLSHIDEAIEDTLRERLALLEQFSAEAQQFSDDMEVSSTLGSRPGSRLQLSPLTLDP